jgi:hypothetical protein
MNFVVSIASLYNSSFKVSIISKISTNLKKSIVMSSFNLNFFLAITLPKKISKFVTVV